MATLPHHCQIQILSMLQIVGLNSVNARHRTYGFLFVKCTWRITFGSVVFVYVKSL